MAWIKSASNYLPDWIQASDDYRVHARSWAVFFRDGVLIGIVCGVLIASTRAISSKSFLVASSSTRNART